MLRFSVFHLLVGLAVLLAPPACAQPKPLAKPQFLGNFFQNAKDRPEALSFSKDGRHLFFTLSPEKGKMTHRCFDTDTLKPVWEEEAYPFRTFIRDDSALLGYDWHRGKDVDDRILSFIPWTGGIGKWKKGKELRLPEFRIAPSGMFRVWIPRRGDTLASWVDEEIVFHSLKSGKRLGSVKIGTPDKWGWGDLSQDGKWLAILQEDRFVRLIDTHQREVVSTFKADTAEEKGVTHWKFVFSPDGKELAVLDTARHVASIRDARTGKARFRLGLPVGWRENAFVLFPDGKTLAVSTIDRGATLLDMETGKSHALEPKGSSEAGLIAVSPDGCLLAWANYGKLHLWRLKKKDSAEP